MPLYDEPPPRTPWRVRIFRALVAVTILALIAVIVLVMMLPSLTTAGLDHLFDAAAIKDRHVAVRSVTMQATYLGPLSFRDAAGELSIEEIQLDHAIQNWKPHPGPIRVLGLKATLRQTDAGWQVDGLSDLLAWLATQPPSDAPPPTLPKVQFRAASIDIITADYQEQVALDITATAIATNAYRVVAAAAIRGNPMELAADVDVSSGTVSARWRATVAVGSLEELLPIPATGLLQLSGELQLANWEPSMARVMLAESQLRVAPKGLAISASDLQGLVELTVDKMGKVSISHGLLEGQVDRAVSGPWNASAAKVSASIEEQTVTLTVTQLGLKGPVLATTIDLKGKTTMSGQGAPIPLELQLAVYDSNFYGWELPLTRLFVVGDSESLQITAPELRVARYENSVIRDLKASITLDPLVIEFQAEARLIPLEVLPAPVIGNEELYRASLSGSAAKADAGWTIVAAIESVPQRLRLRVGDTSASGRLAVAAGASWGPDSSSGRASFALLKSSMAMDEMVISADVIAAQATVVDLRAPVAEIEANMAGGELKLASDFSLSGAVIQLPGTLTLEPELAASGELRVRLGEINHGEGHCESLDLTLPFSWTDGSFAESATGALTVTKPGWAALDMRDLIAELSLQPTGVQATAKLRTPQPGLTFDITHQTDWRRGLSSETVLIMPKGDLAPLGKLLGDADMLPAKLSGIGEGSATISLWDGVLAARAESKFTGVNLDMHEIELSVSGVSGGFAMADLVTMRSEPHQRLRFLGIEAGGLRLGEGELVIHLESEKAIFLEDFWVNWCGGTLRTHALHWDNDNPDLNLELRAEKLRLGELAALTKSYGADGTGLLYGKLPLRYHGGKIELRPGFLYSIPGQGGRLSVSQAGMLTAGVPTTHPSYKNLQLAESALRDFRYDYFRLEILEDAKSSPLSLHMLGRAAEEQGGPPFELEFNINTEGTTLDRLLNAGMSLERMLNKGK